MSVQSMGECSSQCQCSSSHLLLQSRLEINGLISGRLGKKRLSKILGVQKREEYDHVVMELLWGIAADPVMLCCFQSACPDSVHHAAINRVH